MYPHDAIAAAVKMRKWHIHAVERNVTACKASSRRKQEEWMVVNYGV